MLTLGGQASATNLGEPAASEKTPITSIRVNASWTKPAGIDFAPASSTALMGKFAALGYRLDRVRSGTADVPRLYLTSLPGDLRALPSVEQRKRLFIRAILPLVLEANESIAADRARLLELLRQRRNGETLTRQERAWLRVLASDYGLEPGDDAGLRQRVDVVSPALALAQAAAESGWGTSRFAHKGNAVFGQRTWVRGNGLVPGRRDADKRHEVKKFTGLRASVAAYMMNLNSHPAYGAFRDARAGMRAAGKPLDGSMLAGALIRYAEIGRDYIETLRIIMRVNRLPDLDRAKLAPPTVKDGPDA
jgi:Bax protein